MVAAVQDFIPGTRGVVVIWGNNVHGLGLGLAKGFDIGVVSEHFFL
jgi:hypothetical protein